MKSFACLYVCLFRNQNTMGTLKSVITLDFRDVPLVQGPIVFGQMYPHISYYGSLASLYVDSHVNNNPKS